MSTLPYLPAATYPGSRGLSKPSKSSQFSTEDKSSNQNSCVDEWTNHIIWEHEGRRVNSAKSSGEGREETAGNGGVLELILRGSELKAGLMPNPSSCHCARRSLSAGENIRPSSRVWET